MEEFKKLLLRAAQAEEIDVELDKTDFENVCEALHAIHHHKGKFYGDFVASKKDEEPPFAFTEMFCEIKRKFVRLENITKTLNKSNKSLPEYVSATNNLLDTYSDLAVYSIMALLLWEDKFFKHNRNKEKTCYKEPDSINEKYCEKDEPQEECEHFYKTIGTETIKNILVMDLLECQKCGKRVEIKAKKELNNE